MNHNKRMMTPRRSSGWAAGAAIGCLVGVYVLSYLLLSRLAYRKADMAGLEGFYFVFPSTAANKLANDLCFTIYWPLVEIDKLLGTGRPRASDPVEALSMERVNTWVFCFNGFGTKRGSG